MDTWDMFAIIVNSMVMLGFVAGAWLMGEAALSAFLTWLKA